MPKRVLVVLRSAPYGDGKLAEGLRTAVGLCLSDHEITVALVGPAALGALVPARADVAQAVATLLEFGHRVWADRGALARWGQDGQPLLPGVAAAEPLELAVAAAAAEAAYAV